ncbi:hypothetical protein Tco_1153654 [Tanacetum coccineum]
MTEDVILQDAGMRNRQRLWIRENKDTLEKRKNAASDEALEDITPYEALYNRNTNLENYEYSDARLCKDKQYLTLKKLDDRKAYNDLLWSQRKDQKAGLGFIDLLAGKKHEDVEAETLLFTKLRRPRNFKEASTDKKWIEGPWMIVLDLSTRIITMNLTTLPTDQRKIGANGFFKTRGMQDERSSILRQVSSKKDMYKNKE